MPHNNNITEPNPPNQTIEPPNILPPQKPNRHKKLIIIGTISFLILIALGSGLFLAVKLQKSPPETQITDHQNSPENTNLSNNINGNLAVTINYSTSPNFTITLEKLARTQSEPNIDQYVSSTDTPYSTITLETKSGQKQSYDFSLTTENTSRLITLTLPTAQADPPNIVYLTNKDEDFLDVRYFSFDQLLDTANTEFDQYQSPLGFQVNYPKGWQIEKESSESSSLRPVVLLPPGTASGEIFQDNQINTTAFNEQAILIETFSTPTDSDYKPDLKELQNIPPSFNIPQLIYNPKFNPEEETKEEVIENKIITHDGEEALYSVYKDTANNFKVVSLRKIETYSLQKTPYLSTVSLKYLAKQNVFSQNLANQIISSFHEQTAEQSFSQNPVTKFIAKYGDAKPQYLPGIIQNIGGFGGLATRMVPKSGGLWDSYGHDKGLTTPEIMVFRFPPSHKDTLQSIIDEAAPDEIKETLIGEYPGWIIYDSDYPEFITDGPTIINIIWDTPQFRMNIRSSEDITSTEELIKIAESMKYEPPQTLHEQITKQTRSLNEQQFQNNYATNYTIQEKEAINEFISKYGDAKPKYLPGGLELPSGPTGRSVQEKSGSIIMWDYYNNEQSLLQKYSDNHPDNLDQQKMYFRIEKYPSVYKNELQPIIDSADPDKIQKTTIQGYPAWLIRHTNEISHIIWDTPQFRMCISRIQNIPTNELIKIAESIEYYPLTTQKK